MAFLNKKEDVIDLELTQYGKYLVSQGKFKPTFYAFFDDDVVYDQRYISSSAATRSLELQKEIEPRILNDTPSFEALYLFHSVDNLKPQDQLIRIDPLDPLEGYSTDVKEKLQQVPDRYFSLTEPLGNSKIAADYAPSFSIQLINGEITGSSAVLTGSSDTIYATKQIPQLNIKNVVTYVMARSEADNPAPEGTHVFPDKTYLAVDSSNYLNLKIEEEHVPLSKENFDVEIFVLDNTGNIDFPLYFTEPQRSINLEEGIFIDELGAVVSPGDLQHAFETPLDSLPAPGPDMVEAYFDITTDRDESDY